MFRIILILIAGLIITSCGSHDADYYTQHPEEMKKKWAECAKMSDLERMADRECTAVNQAENRRFYGDKMERPLQGKGKGKPLPKF